MIRVKCKMRQVLPGPPLSCGLSQNVDIQMSVEPKNTDATATVIENLTASVLHVCAEAGFNATRDDVEVSNGSDI